MDIFQYDFNDEYLRASHEYDEDELVLQLRVESSKRSGDYRDNPVILSKTDVIALAKYFKLTVSDIGSTEDKD
jgi:hypothetical protein